MSSKVTIELDMQVVQRAVAAKVQPAVDKILESVDLPSRIATALLTEPKKKGADHGALEYYMTSRMLMASYGGIDTRAPIEGLIDNAIRESAKEYIAAAMKKERSKVEAAFKKMMADSNSKFAKALLASLENALADEWRFTLETTVSPKEPPSRDYD